MLCIGMDFLRPVVQKYDAKRRSLHSPSRRYNTYNGKYLPKTVKVSYFLHPLYLRKVSVIDKRDFGAEQHYLIKFFENTVSIPLWMTDPSICQSCVIVDKPQCSTRAMADLHNLLRNLLSLINNFQ